jgi:hypothetical protein
MDIMEKTLKELKVEATALGVKDVDAFISKRQVLAAMESIKGVAQPVTNINPPMNPKEEKKSEKHWLNKAEAMRVKLEAQPKVRILVPLEGKEIQGVIKTTYNQATKRQEQRHVSGAVQPVTLNGYMFLVPKGMYVEVPEQIAQVIQDKFNQTSQAGSNILIDRIDPETGRSVAEQL